MQRTVFVAGIVLFAFMATATGSVSALEVSVRGETEMTLDVQAAGTTLIVEGRLVDDIGDPLPAQTVVLVIDRRGTSDSQRVDAETDFFGFFSADIEVPPGRYTVSAEYGGASHVAGAGVARRVFVESAPAQLQLSAPSWILGEDTAYPVEVWATAGGYPLPGEISVFVDGIREGSIELDAEGSAHFDLGPQVRRGRSEVAVQLPATEHRDSATAQQKVRRVVNPIIDGTTEAVFRRLVRGIEVEISVEDQAGPVPDASVTVILEQIGRRDGEERAGPSELVQHAVTGAEGRAAVIFSNTDLGESSWNASARVKPPEGPTVIWEGGVVESEPSQWALVLRILAAFVLVLGALWLARRLVALIWDELRRRLRFRREGKAEVVDEIEEDPFAAVEQVQLEAVPVSASDGEQGLRIQVWDEWRDEPVRNALLIVNHGDGQREELQSNAAGVVALESLVGLAVELRAEAAGFVPAEVRLRAEPGARLYRLSLTAVPLKIRRAYRKMIRRLDGTDRWGALTPRQIEETLRGVEEAGRLTPAWRGPERSSTWRDVLEGWDDIDDDRRFEILVEAITSVVEETNYSGRAYDAKVWTAARKAMKELIELVKSSEQIGDEEP